MKGFVTIATGDEKYFILAANLLKSYRYFTKERYPFAIITDKENEYTELFDKVVLLKNAEKNYMDKIKLLDSCPFEENIFIDADCLAYKDLNEYWNYFKKADDFSCFGKVLPLDSENGIFRKEDVAEYSDKIKFVTHLHGVIYFIRRSKKCKQLLETCLDIIDNYSKYYFKGFEDPSDESVFALAMAVHNLRPIERQAKLYIFLPVANYFKANIQSGYLSYSTTWDERVENGMLVHWANVNTKRMSYKVETYKLQKIINNEELNAFEINSLKLIWKFKDMCSDFEKKITTFQSALKSKIYYMLNRKLLGRK